MPGRKFNGGDYRYGFQGQEVDDEIKGEGNSVNYKYRMHDPRLGRFFAVDPLTSKYPHYSPYSFSGNKVIQFVKLEGLEEARSAAQDPNMGLTMAIDGVQSGTIIQEQIKEFQLQALNTLEPSADYVNFANNIALGMSTVDHVASAMFTNGWWISKTKAKGYTLKLPSTKKFNGGLNYYQRRGGERLMSLTKMAKKISYAATVITLIPDIKRVASKAEEESNIGKGNLIKSLPIIAIGLRSTPTGIGIGIGQLISNTDEVKEEVNRNIIEKSRDFESSNNYEYRRIVQRKGLNSRDMSKDVISEKK